MQIIWFGNSCFLLKTSTGKRILMDPFYNTIENEIDFPESNVITVSHSYFDKSSLNQLNNTTKVIDTPDFFDLTYAKIQGIYSYQDNLNGLKRGKNIIYLVYADDLCICHLGNLGCNLNAEIINKLSNIDILFIPIGGHFTLYGIQAAKLCNLLCPKLVIPMHYKNSENNLILNTAKDFIINMKNVTIINSNSVDIAHLEDNYTKTLILNNTVQKRCQI